jgi:hypothetical protein
MERQTLGTEYQKNQNFWTGAIAGMLMSVAVPTVLAEVIPATAKTLFLAGAVSVAVASATPAKGLNSRTRRHHLAMENAADQAIERDIVNQSIRYEAMQGMEHQNELQRWLDLMQQYEPQKYLHWRAYLEQEGYIAPLPQAMPVYQTIPTTAQSVPAYAASAPVAASGGAIAHQPVSAVTPQPISYGSNTAPNLGAIADPIKRMNVLLEALANEGFPLGTLLNHPFVWCWGRSQSGKTTIAMLTAIARMVLGHNVGYFTTDDDYPRQLPWSQVSDSPKGYEEALEKVSDIISNASKGALKGNSWVFDEMLAAYQEHGIDLERLLVCVLMKGAKTKAGVIAISQADTSSAHGLSGLDAAWRIERISVEAIHTEDSMGNRSPTGRYLVDNGDKEKGKAVKYEWKIPAWMLTEKNEWGVFDPVVWMMNRFPELQGMTYAAPKPEPRDRHVAEAQPEEESELVDAQTAYARIRELQDRKLQTKGERLTNAELQQEFYDLTGVWVEEGETLNYLWVLINGETQA